MTFLETVRNKSFWFIDAFRGHPIGKHYREIKTVLADYNSKEAKTIINNNLSTLLKHASSTTTFYKDYQGINDINKFPIISKILVKERYEDFMSSTYKDKNNFKVSSSGSTGIPFELYQNSEKRYRNVADSIVFAERAGVPIGIKVIIMSIWNIAKKKNFLLAWMQNVDMQEVTDLNDEEVKRFLINLQKKSNYKGIWAYASALDNLAHYLNTNNLDMSNANVNAIVACSEKLDDNTKISLEKHLNTSVLSRYSNAESGIFAQKIVNGDSTFFMNHGSYHFEILKFENDTPQEYGKPGRIILTDLLNHCMPLIRYDTGDVGTVVLNENNVPVFSKIEGRKQDLIYNTKGELISSFAITNIMIGLTHIKQYQFIQEDKTNYTLKVNAPYLEKDKVFFTSKLKALLGDDANITIEYIEEIPLLSSGKRQRVVSKYLKEV